jgi:hypothetical protein
MIGVMGEGEEDVERGDEREKERERERRRRTLHLFQPPRAD